MTSKQRVSKSKIKNYWETRAPQVWYSTKKVGSLEWFNEIEYQRYHVYYEYIPTVAEFNYHKGEDVLEIGCGVGTDSVQFAKGGAHVTGVDLTENAVEVTKRNFAVKGYKYKELRTADAEKLPFKDRSFDYVYSFGVLHHTPNTPGTIREVHRVLKSEGTCTIMLYSRGWKHYVKRVFIHGILLGKLFKYGYSRLINRQTEVHGNSPLTYVYTKREIKRMFSMFGDVDIKRYRMGEYFEYAPYKTRMVWGWIKNLIGIFQLERLFGENYIIKAKKTPRKRRYSFLKTIFKP